MDDYKVEIDNVLADSDASVADKVEQLLAFVDRFGDEYKENLPAIAMAYEAVYKLLFDDNNNMRHADDLIMCNCLLCETYFSLQKTWLIAQHARMALTNIVLLVNAVADDSETLQLYDSALDRIISCLQETRHPRLEMKLLMVKARIDARLDDDYLGDLRNALTRIVTLSALTDDNSVMHDVKDLLDAHFLAGEVQTLFENPYDHTSHLKRDPVEYTPRWEEVIDEVEARLDELLRDESHGMGFCHHYWYEKACMLREYGIEWRSPAQMNPGVLFD